MKHLQIRLIFIQLLLLLLSSSKIYASDTLVFNSKNIPSADTVLIFYPATYQTQNIHFPLVYMLHGFGGDYTSFSQLLDLQNLSNQYGFIIVCPDGLTDSWYLNSPIRTNKQFESFFFDELYPEINRTYRIDTNAIFITGYSMGGHGAMYLFLRNKEKFKAAASSSGTLNLSYSSLKLTSLSSLLGDFELHANRFDQFSSFSHIDSISFLDKPILIDCGLSDYLFRASDEFASIAKEKRVNLTYMVMPGAHNADYWKKSFPYHFVFFSEQLKSSRKD